MGLPQLALTGKRPATGSWSKGRFTEGAYTALSLRASVQPLSPGARMQSLPEGRRESSAFTLFTLTELMTVDVNDDHNPDIITIYGLEYEVMDVQNWQNGTIPHYEAVVAKII